MIGLIQRVTAADVVVEGASIGQIGEGLVVLVGFQKADTEALIPKFIEKITQFRIFSDRSGKMNLSVADRGGQILWVPQFTLAADTRSGRRPSFQTAAPPDDAKTLFKALQGEALISFPQSTFGEFGAHMAVSLTNNGPVTFWVEVN